MFRQLEAWNIISHSIPGIKSELFINLHKMYIGVQMYISIIFYPYDQLRSFFLTLPFVSLFKRDLIVVFYPFNFVSSFKTRNRSVEIFSQLYQNQSEFVVQYFSGSKYTL